MDRKQPKINSLNGNVPARGFLLSALTYMIALPTVNMINFSFSVTAIVSSSSCHSILALNSNSFENQGRLQASCPLCGPQPHYFL